jgi:hypothetical protein
MGGIWPMTEPPEVRAELVDLGVPAIGCGRPVMHDDDRVFARLIGSSLVSRCSHD